MRDDPFVTHRSLLFTVAYEMLGSAADAEDVVQETWLRWADVEGAEVRNPRAYLLRIVTRQALNRLRTLARRREEYVGEWLPEPLPPLRTWPRMWSSPRVSRSRSADRAGDPRARRTGGLRVARGLRGALRRHRASGRQDAGCGQADRPPGQGARGRTAAADTGRSCRAPAGGRTLPGGAWDR